MNPVDKAIEIAGGLTALGNALSVSAQVVTNWRKRGVPIEQCPAIERVTNGAVSRRDLRPNDWQAIWPELIEPRTQGDANCVPSS